MQEIAAEAKEEKVLEQKEERRPVIYDLSQREKDIRKLLEADRSKFGLTAKEICYKLRGSWKGEDTKKSIKFLEQEGYIFKAYKDNYKSTTAP